MEILSMICVGIFCVICFSLGYKAKNNSEKLINSPVEVVQEIQTKIEEKKKKTELEEIFYQINNYDAK